MLVVLALFGGCDSGTLPPPPGSPATPSPIGAPVVQPTIPLSSRALAKGQPPGPAQPREDSPRVAEATPNATQSNVAGDSVRPKIVGMPVKGSEAAGNFIMALCHDLDGNVWVGTEDHGVLRGTPEGVWTQFTTKDGLGDDNAYAICCDRLGRVWAGQLNHGVAVFNGETWRTYDVLDGPLGERIFDIACCPTDGDVWMATSAGFESVLRR